ncbi:unnamed protein product, partial [Meganyctiphanes norvegica]
SCVVVRAVCAARKLSDASADLIHTGYILNVTIIWITEYIKYWISSAKMRAVFLSPCLVLLIAIFITTAANVCPAEFFMSRGSDQCFKLFKERYRTWTEANIKCKSEGLQLAIISDAVAVELRKNLLDIYGDEVNAVWLDARGDGSNLVWQRNGTPLRNDSPLWWPMSPGSRVTSNYCLALLVWKLYWTSHPGRPYTSHNCLGSSLGSHHTLCEDGLSENNNKCKSRPCIHGTCINGINSYRCDCLPEYGGNNCDIKITTRSE